MPVTAALDLDTPYKLTQSQIDQFRKEGFIKLRNVLSPEVLEHYGKEITKKVLELNTLNIPMSQRTTYQKAFLQIMNLWRQSEIVKKFVFSKKLAKIATELMGTRGVRMYHDQALYKEKGGGVTPWHADQYYWPLSNENTCTAWIPLQYTPQEMGPLAFAARSQHMAFGRDLAISDESEKQLQQALQDANFDYVDAPFDLGEVSFHYGWTYHRAGPNTSDRAREVMTIIYMDVDMKLIEPKNIAHRNDHKSWMPGAKVGEVIDTPLNPVLFIKG